MQTVAVDTELLSRAAAHRRRAANLRTEASQLDPFVGTSFRRRASELELEAWVMEIQSGLPYERIANAA
ncbi:MAG: hypothetical protein HYX32_11820 [Actinobacteria bacterium]|nr:hypothetical protein [Actinomycetota bacterium]